MAIEISKDGGNYILFVPKSMDDFEFSTTYTYNRKN